MSIKKTECQDVDRYQGTAEELIAAGLVRADQFPPAGRLGISYSHGKYVRGRCKIDEGYLRVELKDDLVTVFVGVSVETAQARKGTHQRRWWVDSNATIPPARAAAAPAVAEPAIDLDIMRHAWCDVFERHSYGQSNGHGMRWESGFSQFLCRALLGLGGRPDPTGVSA
jgi:hypothetical protein